MFTANNSIYNSNIAKFVLVALAYFITAKLGLMVPYKESVATMMWLPTGGNNALGQH